MSKQSPEIHHFTLPYWLKNNIVLMVAGKMPLIGQRIYYFMGNSLYQLGRYSEAVNAYRRALQIKPDYIEAKQALMNTRKIMQVLQAKQPVQAP